MVGTILGYIACGLALLGLVWGIFIVSLGLTTLAVSAILMVLATVLMNEED